MIQLRNMKQHLALINKTSPVNLYMKSQGAFNVIPPQVHKRESSGIKVGSFISEQFGFHTLFRNFAPTQASQQAEGRRSRG